MNSDIVSLLHDCDYDDSDNRIYRFPHQSIVIKIFSSRVYIVRSDEENHLTSIQMPTSSNRIQLAWDLNHLHGTLSNAVYCNSPQFLLQI